MQDIKIVRKNKTKTKKTKWKHIVIFGAMVLIILHTLSFIGNYLSRKDNGAMWVYGVGSVKMVQEQVYDPEVLLSALKPKKVVKVANIKPDEVMKHREQKYKPIIEKYFPEEPKTMLAIAKAESSLNSSALNYNCYYDSKGNVHSKRPKGGVSKSCKKGHEKYAWSKDGCVMQVNSSHGEDISQLDQCMKMARKIYETQGKKAWVAYNTGAYKKYLD